MRPSVHGGGSEGPLDGRSVRGVAAAVGGLLAAGVVGFVAAALSYTVIGLVVLGREATREVLGIFAAVMIVIGVGGSLVVGAGLLTRRVVPRVAGDAHQRVPVERARTLVVIAAVVAGVLVGLLFLEGGLLLVLAWGLGVAGAGVSGAYLGARRAERRAEGPR